MPAAGWKQILKRTQQQIKEDNVPLLAAGVAFYIFIALFPALIAAVTIYGLVSDPAEVEQQVAGFAGSLPAETATLIEEQLKDIASNSGGSLGSACSPASPARCSRPAAACRTSSRRSTSPTTRRRPATSSSCAWWRWP
jgi:uncharacterized BrkB/YihY/UPF0761 family membrane protein